MGFLSLPEDNISITLEDSEGGKATFTLKRALSKADVNFALMRVLEATQNMPRREETATVAEAQPLTLDIVMTMPDGQLAVLERALVGWDLTYPSGHPDHPQAVPLERENIEMLTSPVVDALCAELRHLNHVMTGEERQNLGGNSSHTSTRAISSRKS